MEDPVRYLRGGFNWINEKYQNVILENIHFIEFNHMYVLNLDKKVVVLYSNEENGIHKTKTEYMLPKWVQTLSESKERVSGRELHWEEGLVIRPYIDRVAKDGTLLRLKVISKFYKETGEEIN